MSKHPRSRVARWLSHLIPMWDRMGLPVPQSFPYGSAGGMGAAMPDGANLSTYAPQPLIGFESRKAAQIAAFFVSQSASRKLPKLKLIKLVYLAERAFLARYGYPMLFDEMYSLPHGPICSSTLNSIDGRIYRQTWRHYVELDGNVVVLKTPNMSRDALDEISNAEWRIIAETWAQFGKMSASEIRNYTHEHCKEFTEVKKGRLPINYVDVLVACGKTVEFATTRAHAIHDLRRAAATKSA